MTNRIYRTHLSQAYHRSVFVQTGYLQTVELRSESSLRPTGHDENVRELNRIDPGTPFYEFATLPVITPATTSNHTEVAIH